MTVGEIGATRRLARFIRGLRYQDLPEEVVTMAKWHTFNILGCALPGYSLKSTQIIVRAHQHIGGSPHATVLGSGGKKLPVPVAAAINTSAAYAPMNDETFFEGPSHLGHSVIPAALAAAEKEGMGGADFLTAVVAGYEVGNRIVASMAQDAMAHYESTGWRINICDGFGAGVAAGKLLNLDEDQLVVTIGIVAGSGCGLVKNQHDTTHPYLWVWDAGRATYLGTLGAYMAQEGMTAARAPLEDEYGFVSMYTGGHPPPKAFTRLTQGLGTEWEILKVQMKRWVAGGRQQASIDAAVKAVRDNGIKSEQIRRIEFSGSGLHGSFLSAPWTHAFRDMVPFPPKDVLSEFDFAWPLLPYVIAVAIVDGLDFIVADDIIAHLNDPTVRELTAKVNRSAQTAQRFASLYGDGHHNWPGWAMVETTDGRKFEANVEFSKGKFPENPFTEEEIIAKFRKNAHHRLPSDRIDEIVAKVKSLEKVKDMREFANLFSEPIPKR